MACGELGSLWALLCFGALLFPSNEKVVEEQGAIGAEHIRFACRAYTHLEDGKQIGGARMNISRSRRQFQSLRKRVKHKWGRGRGESKDTGREA